MFATNLENSLKLRLNHHMQKNGNDGRLADIKPLATAVGLKMHVTQVKSNMKSHLFYTRLYMCVCVCVIKCMSNFITNEKRELAVRVACPLVYYTALSCPCTLCCKCLRMCSCANPLTNYVLHKALMSM